MSSPWRQPFEAALQRNAPQAEVQVATVSPEGIPAVRTVLLRGVSEEGEPYFFTDTRSRKADHLRENPRLALVGWFPKSREQFRLTGRTSLHGMRAEGPWAELRQRAWTDLPAEEQQFFLGPPPGHALITRETSPVPPGPPQEFLVVSLQVQEADWLSETPPPSRVGFRLIGAGWVQQALTP